MKTTKKKAKSGMNDAARADWRASKTADLGRANALKKLAATPEPKAKKPARAFPAPADAAPAPTVPAEAATAAPVPEVAPTAPDGPAPEVAADGANVAPNDPAAPTSDSNAAPAAGQEQGDGKPDKPKRTRIVPIIPFECPSPFPCEHKSPISVFHRPRIDSCRCHFCRFRVATSVAL